MRSIRDIGLSLLCGGLIVVAGACTRTTESERSGQAPKQANAAPPAPAGADTADETFAPTEGNRLANADGANGAAAPAAPVTRVITVPEGTSLPLVLTSAVASDTSQVEDPVSARLASSVNVEGTAAIPEGSVVRGTVSDVQRSGRVKGVARLGIRFHTLVIGEQSYDIRTAPVSRQAKSTVKKDTQKVAVPAAAGGVIGAIAGGGKGAAIGAAAGAAAGTGAVLATRGQEVRLASGSRVTTTLSEPLDVTVEN